MNELADYATLVFTQIKKKQTHRRPHTLFLSVPFGSLMWSLFNTYSRNTLKRNRTLFLLLFNVDINCAHISFIFRTMFEISKIGARRFRCFTSPSQFLSLTHPFSIFISIQIMACYHGLLCLFLQFHENSFTRFKWYFDRTRLLISMYTMCLNFDFRFELACVLQFAWMQQTITRAHRHLCAFTEENVRHYCSLNLFKWVLAAAVVVKSIERNVLVQIWRLAMITLSFLLYPHRFKSFILSSVCACWRASMRMRVNDVRVGPTL